MSRASAPHPSRGDDSGSVLVVGAGLCGLVCAFELARRGVSVRVLEASPRPGGVIGSFERDGFLFERGPNTVPSSASEFVRLCADLSIQDRLRISRPSARERYLWHRGRLTPVPATPGALLTTRLLSVRAKLALFTEPLRPFRERGGSEPDLETFLRERIGREATRVLAGAFVRGIYAAELGELGARSAMPKLWQWASEEQSLVRGFLAERRKNVHTRAATGAHTLLSFPKGFQELVDALAGALGDRLATECFVSKVERSAEKWSVVLRGGDVLRADRVVLATPAPTALRLLQELSPESNALAALRGIGHANMTLVHLGFDGRELESLPSGFGFLVPPHEGERDATDARLLGTIFTSNVFEGRAPPGCHAMTSFYANGEPAMDAPHSADAAAHWSATACRDLARVLDRTEAPRARVAEVQHWREVIPRYAPGHAERMRQLQDELRAQLPGLFLCASYIGGVSVENVIASARAAASSIIGTNA